MWQAVPESAHASIHGRQVTAEAELLSAVVTFFESAGIPDRAASIMPNSVRGGVVHI